MAKSRPPSGSRNSQSPETAPSPPTGRKPGTALRLFQRLNPLFAALLGALTAGFVIYAALDARIEKKVEDYTDDVTKGERGEAGAPGLPGPSVAVGTVMAWPLDLPPSGWLLCDGHAKPRKGDYQDLAELFEKNGFPYGDGDGHSTFNVPDYRGYFLRGLGGKGGADPDADRVIGSTQGDATALPKAGFKALPAGSHTHEIKLNPDGTGTNPAEAEIGGGDRSRDSSAPVRPAPDHEHVIGGGDVETRPVNKAIHWIIYAGEPPQG